MKILKNLFKSIKLFIVLVIASFTSLLATQLEYKEYAYDQVIHKSYYSSYYNYELKGPVMVKYQLDGDLVNKINIKKRPGFRSEKKIPAKYRNYSSDFKKQPTYNKGHMLADAATDFDKAILKEAYEMSNIAVQSSKLNQGPWKRLEAYARTLAVEYGTVFVENYIRYKQPLKRIGRHEIAVPYKITKKIEYFDETKALIKECYAFPNENSLLISKKFKDYKVQCSD